MSTTQTTPFTPQRLTGRTTIVTGGSRDTGAAVAYQLATDGVRVAVVYRSSVAEADAVVNRIRSTDAQAIAVQANVGDAVSVDTMVSTVHETFGAANILVNNAGILEDQPIGSIDLTSFGAQFRVNTLSTILVTQAALPHVPAHGRHIVNVSSSLVYQPRAGLAAYAASKAAVGALTHAFTVELGPRNIAINAMAPALAHTDMTAPIPNEVKTHMHESTPMGRLAEPDDIVDAITFLTSDDTRWIAGHTLMIDGGFI